MTTFRTKTWAGVEDMLPTFLNAPGPMLMQIDIDPEQTLEPKLGYELVDGKQQYQRFDRLSPLTGEHNG
jgi:hypothetical protein